MIAAAAFAVVVPALDEADLIGSCVTSVRAALRHVGAELGAPGVLVVAADSCRDGTEAAAAAAWRSAGPERAGERLVIHRGQWRCVGRARAAGTELALRHLTGRRGAVGEEAVWIGNTDADTEVPGDWLAAQHDLAADGWDAVAGVIDVEDFSGHPAHAESVFRRTYLLHADGTHPHVHGANLGVRASTYRAAGGWHPLGLSEDHDLWRRIGEAGGRRTSSTALVVRTSGRPFGRAAGGFADTLREVVA